MAVVKLAVSPLFFLHIFLHKCYCYDSFTGVSISTAATATSPLAFFNDRGMPLFAYSDIAASSTLSWYERSLTLNDYWTINENTDLSAFEYGVSLEFVSSLFLQN